MYTTGNLTCHLEDRLINPEKTKEERGKKY
jgi:hypothetical protein